MNVEFLDLGAAYRELANDIDAAMQRVLASGWYVLGPEVDAFEREFAAFVGAKHCVGVGNGLDALHLALRAVGVGPGDEVIVPSNTYIATWLAVNMCGARPMPVEPDEATFNLDPQKIADAISPRTRAILPVHLYGQPADMASITQVAAQHDLRVVDDAAQAHGARWAGTRIGCLADATAWSFYPTKNLGALGDAGAVTTNSPEIAATVARLRNYGSDVKHKNAERGVNTRLDELQAAVLRVKLGVLDEWNARRRSVAAAYAAGLAESDLVLPAVAELADPVWHLFVVRTGARDELARGLADRGVTTMIHYPYPPHLQPAYADAGWTTGAFPVCERIHGTVLSLPLSPHLEESAVDYVVESVSALAV